MVIYSFVLMDWLKGKPTRKKPMIWPPIYEGFLQIFPSTILGFSVWQLSFVDRASFQDPRLEVPTIYKAYVSKGIPPENMALYGTVPPF